MSRRGAALLAALSAMAVVVLPVPGAAQTDPAPEAALRLVEATPWVGDGVDFDLSVLISAAPAGSRLQVTVRDRVRNRSEFTRSVLGEGLRTRVYGPQAVPVETLDTAGGATVAVSVPLVAADGIRPAPITTAGVYPVVVELLGPDDGVLDTLRTHLVRLPASDATAGTDPLGVAIVLPLEGAPAHLDPLGPVPDDDFAGRIDVITQALGTHPDIAVNLAPTPESIDAAATTDTGRVSALAATLDGSQVIGGPWVDIEEAAWARSGDDTLARELARGGEALASHLGGAPTSTRLVASGAAAEEVTTMVDEGAGFLIVDDADLEALDTRDFPYTLARPFQVAVGDGDDAAGTTVPALAGDENLAELAASADDDPVLAAHLVLADLAVIAADEPESPRVATLIVPEVAARSPEFLAELLAGLEPPPAPPAEVVTDPNAAAAQPAPIPAPDPVLAATTVDAALVAVEPAGADGGIDASDPLVRRVITEGTVGDITAIAEPVARRRADLASMRTVFGAGDPLANAVDNVLATAVAQGLDDDERQQALASVEQAMAAQLGGIGGPDRQQVRLTARAGRIQLVLTNETGRPANVTLVFRGDRLVIPDAIDGQLPVSLVEPITRVDLRVEARSSGDAPLDIRLTSPDGRLILGETRITIRTTAVSGVGVFLMGAAAVFLAAWWTKTIVAERRSSRPRHPAHMKANP